ncbi:MAG: peptidase lon domain protein [Frankiales bacterium]|nr:peptidase lon domain protein [Frankiales bacterium]
MEPNPDADDTGEGAAGADTEPLPLFPLATVLVPDMTLALNVFEPRYRTLLADLLNDANPAPPVFGVVALRHGWEVGEFATVHDVGTTARITDLTSLADGRSELAAVGERRFVIESLDSSAAPYLIAQVRYLAEPDGEVSERGLESVAGAWRTHLAALAALTGKRLTVAEPPDSPRALSYAVTQLPSLPLIDRQALLACADTASRLKAARRILRRENILIQALHAIPASALRFGNPAEPG